MAPDLTLKTTEDRRRKKIRATVGVKLSEHDFKGTKHRSELFMNLVFWVLIERNIYNI